MMFNEILKKFIIDKAEYQSVKSEINESNRKCLLVFSAVTGAVIWALFIASKIGLSSILYASTLYLICGILLVVVLAFSIFILPRVPVITEFVVYAFDVALLTFGVFMGTMDDPDMTSSIFIVLVFATPILFTIKPARVNFINVVMTVVFVIMESRAKIPDVFLTDMVNAFSFMVLSFFCAAYLMSLKIHQLAVEQANNVLKDREIERERAEKELIYKKTYVDSLTGLLNRTAYMEHFAELQEQDKENLTIVSIDANGLKVVNDLYGHKAGDELLTGVAQSIDRAFGNYGKNYRMGGDEFLSVLKLDSGQLSEAINWMQHELKAFSGEYVKGITVACGFARADENPELSFEDLEKLADKKMYEDKNEYYCKNGLDRRKGCQ